MKKLLSSLFVVGLLTGAASAQPFGDEWIRFFFDTKGVDTAAAARPANSPLNFTNPTVVGSDRLYIYLQYGRFNAAVDAQNMSGFNVRMDITGPATITGGQIFNKSVSGLDRWQNLPTPNPVPGSTSWWPGSIFKVGTGGYGAKNTPDFTTVESQDTHFRQGDDGSEFGTTLLGYVDVAHSGGVGNATMKFSNGDSGNAGVTVTNGDTVYFGFGDAGTQNKAGRTSTDPDAIIAPIPEPMTLSLLALGALALRRRK